MDHFLKDRTEAGKLLSSKLIKFKARNDTVILALPRGGVPVAYEIANRLLLPFDMLLVRKLGFPKNEEYAMGSITLNNKIFINPEIAKCITLEDPILKPIINKERAELARRNKVYRNNEPMPNLTNKIVILVDDGIATGATAKAAIQAIGCYVPKSIVLAVPILPADKLNEFKALVDEVVFLAAPEAFLSVGSWYENFPQLTDNKVIELYNKSIQTK